MRNFIQEGDNLDLTAPHDVLGGDGVLVGAIFGVATTNAASGSSVVVATTGVYDLPKAGATVFALGARVSWDATADRCAAPGSGLFPIGAAVAAAGNGSATVRVRLDEISTTAAP